MICRMFIKTEDHNQNKMWKIFLVFDDMIADMIFNQKLYQVVTKMYISEVEN